VLLSRKHVAELSLSRLVGRWTRAEVSVNLDRMLPAIFSSTHGGGFAFACPPWGSFPGDIALLFVANMVPFWLPRESKYRRKFGALLGAWKPLGPPPIPSVGKMSILGMGWASTSFLPFPLSCVAKQ